MRLQIHVGALHGLGTAGGSPQVAKGSGVLLRWAPPRRAQLLTAPQPQRRAQKWPRFPVPRTHTPPGSCGVGVPTFTGPTKGLSEETEHRGPLSLMTLAGWDPGNYSLITSAGLRRGCGEFRLRLHVAVGYSQVLERGAESVFPKAAAP